MRLLCFVEGLHLSVEGSEVELCGSFVLSLAVFELFADFSLIFHSLKSLGG